MTRRLPYPIGPDRDPYRPAPKAPTRYIALRAESLGIAWPGEWLWPGERHGTRIAIDWMEHRDQLSGMKAETHLREDIADGWNLRRTNPDERQLFDPDGRSLQSWPLRRPFVSDYSRWYCVVARVHQERSEELLRIPVPPWAVPCARADLWYAALQAGLPWADICADGNGQGPLGTARNAKRAEKQQARLVALAA